MGLERFFEVLALGVRSLLRNKLRTFLTMLGMIFGVGSVIAMLAVGAGARAEILARIEALGIRNVIVNSVEPPEDVEASSEAQWMVKYGLTFDDAQRIERTLPGVERVLRVNRARDRVRYGPRRVEADVLGVPPAYLEMFGLEVQRGRLFNAVDEAAAHRVCVVRPDLVRQLQTLEEPIGMWVRIGGYPFQVVGVLAEERFRSHARQALAIDGSVREVYVPYTTAMRTFGTVTYFERAGSTEFTEVEVDQLVVTVRSAEDVFPTARAIQACLAHAHERDDTSVVVPLELLRQSEETQRVFNLVMVLIAGISLLVGGIGIANIMLATITERTREIGVRRALGARRRDIVVQFLTETTAIAALGGLIGVAAGLAGIAGLVSYTDWKARVAPQDVLLALGISCAVGVLSGIFPARRAARMDPITALRFE